jgi:prevent-host-death family protein
MPPTLAAASTTTVGWCSLNQRCTAGRFPDPARRGWPSAGRCRTAERVVNVHEAKTHFSKLIDAAHAGETILMAKGGKPWARLMPLELPRPRRQQLLLDTHAAYVSAASGWEIATKARLGKLPGIDELLNNLPQQLIAQGFELLPITCTL